MYFIGFLKYKLGTVFAILQVWASMRLKEETNGKGH